jgi:hypothetical protein
MNCGRAIKKRLNKTSTRAYTNTQTYGRTIKHSGTIARTITTQTNTEEGKPGKPVDAKSLLARFKRGRCVVPYRRPVGGWSPRSRLGGGSRLAPLPGLLHRRGGTDKWLEFCMTSWSSLQSAASLAFLALAAGPAARGRPRCL